MNLNKSSIYFFVFYLFFSCSKTGSTEQSNLSAKGYERQLIFKDKIVAWTYDQDGKQGLKDTLGNIILPAMYDYIEDWIQFGVIRIDSGGQDKSGSDYVYYEMNKIGLVDFKGNILFEPQFDELNFNGFPLALVRKDEKYGYVNNKGEFAIPLNFEYASTFQNGFAVIKTKNGYGLIDSNNQSIVAPQFDSLALHYATGFSKDTMLLVFNHIDSIKMINKDGQIFDLIEEKTSN